MLTKERRALFKAGSLAAYKNSLELLEDANLLFRNSRFARAYALAELSLEEFAKAFLYRCYSAGLIRDAEFQRDLNKHEEKLFHAIHLMSTAALTTPLFEALEHDKGVSDHSRHIFPLKVQEIAKSQRLDRVIDMLKDAHKRKLSSLYVEVEPHDESVKSPADHSWEEQIDSLLTFMNAYANGFEVILDAEDSRFVGDAKLLDPQIFSGTMKSDFTKFRRGEAQI